MGNLLTQTDPLGNVTGYEYDDLYRLTSQVDPDPDGAGPLASPITTFTYSADSQFATVTDLMGRVTSYAYDDLGRRTGVTLPDPDGEGGVAPSIQLTSYDLVGNVRFQTDPLGNVTEYRYDDLYRLTQQSEPDPDGEGSLSSPTTIFTYDPVGNLKTLTDPVQNTTEWFYDDLNRVSEETNELGLSRYFQYDAVGNLTQRTDRNGRVIDYEYDDLHRMTDERWLSGVDVVRTITFAYNDAGQLSGISDPSAGYAYTYDDLDRRETETVNLTGLTPSVTLTSGYDAASRRTQLSSAIGTQDDFINDYVYDNMGRLTSVQQHAPLTGNAVADKRVDFSYNAASQFEGISRFADLSATQLVASTGYTYDGMGRLTDLTHFTLPLPLAQGWGEGTLAGYQYQYDAASRITQFVSYLDGTTNYTHDNTDQLTGADHDYQDDEGYAYDENGNRAAVATGGSPVDYTTGANNRLLTDGTYTYAYDNEGNRTQRFIDTNADGQLNAGDTDITEYVWDHRNRLVQVIDRDTPTGPATQIVDYAYDHANRWVDRTIDPDGAGPAPAESQYFIYDGNQIVLQFEEDVVSTTHLTNRYLWGPLVDQILADEQVVGELTEGTALWPLTDHLGTVRDLAQFDDQTETASIVNHRVFDSYGQIISETNLSDPAADPAGHFFAFTGRPLDEATHLQNNLNRWYDNTVGRWLSEDPIVFEAGDVNLYRYVGNGVISEKDPNGLETFPSSVWDRPGMPSRGPCRQGARWYHGDVAADAVADAVLYGMDWTASLIVGSGGETFRTLRDRRLAGLDGLETLLRQEARRAPNVARAQQEVTRIMEAMVRASDRIDEAGGTVYVNWLGGQVCNQCSDIVDEELRDAQLNYYFHRQVCWRGTEGRGILPHWMREDHQWNAISIGSGSSRRVVVTIDFWQDFDRPWRPGEDAFRSTFGTQWRDESQTVGALPATSTAPTSDDTYRPPTDGYDPAPWGYGPRW